MRPVVVIILLLVAAPLLAQTDSLMKVDTVARRSADSVVVAPAAQAVEGSDRQISLSIVPQIGVTYSTTDDAPGEETTNLQWLAKVNGRYSNEGEPTQFMATLFAQFGQFVSEDGPPEKTADNLILTLVPSLTLSHQLGLRLFLEVTGETQFAKGIVDDTIESKFADPLFLYETVFLGHKTNLASEDGTKEFQFTIGVGYAFQQTVTKDFVLQSNRQYVIGGDNPLQDVQDALTLENGYSGVFDLYYSDQISEDVVFRTSLKTVLLTKDGFFDDYSLCRVSSLLQTGVSYKIFSIDYTNRIAYDNEVSSRRQMSQTLVFGLRVEI
jgi:hypothetical protein